LHHGHASSYYVTKYFWKIQLKQPLITICCLDQDWDFRYLNSNQTTERFQHCLRSNLENSIFFMASSIKYTVWKLLMEQIQYIISKLMTFVENAQTGRFLFLVMFILSCFTCYMTSSIFDLWRHSIFFKWQPALFSSLSDTPSYYLNDKWKKKATLHNNFFEKISLFGIWIYILGLGFLFCKAAFRIFTRVMQR
jgi:hypothetical protein